MTRKRRSLLSRKSVKISLLGVEFITRFKKKKESFGHWVDIAISERYWKEIQDEKNRKIMMMTTNTLYIENQKLEKDVSYLKERNKDLEMYHSRDARELLKFRNSLS